ncbi:MAG TPA: nucleotide sugar dehydrogenase [Ktedonobacteraceae bacterium]|nr:nucleotide sugar dehydrogenase [Ktedonobacteraceae bacterium]
MQKNWRNDSQQRMTVAVVGLGKIGLPLAVQYAQHGYDVIGCDINSQVVEAVNAGISHVQEEPELMVEVPRLVHEGLLSATVDTTAAVRRANAVVVIVPVFVDAEHNVDFRSIDAATQAVGAGLKSGTLVSYETTLPVGTTSQRFRQLLEAGSGLNAGHDFYLAYSPERVSSGSIFRDLRTYPKVVGGIDEKSTAAAVQFYQSVLDAEVITMASADESEFVKLIETTYRDVNIALANEYAQFADARGLNVTTAIAAANTQPYSHIHSPGVGVGGHCIPVYPYFLLAGLEEMRLKSIHPLQNGFSNAFHRQIQVHESAYKSKGPMLTLPRYARQINDAMAEYAVQRLQAAIGSLADQPVLILGVAYRGDVREVAFTSAKLLQKALLEYGAVVYVDDPLFSEDELRALGYTPLTAEIEGKIRAIIVQAGHQAYRSLDFSRFGYCQVVLDGRRALQDEQIEALGTRYITIGDGDLEKTKNVRGEQQAISSVLFERGY